jgi:hypothetical protein
MKKLILILIAGLLWCNISFAGSAVFEEGYEEICYTKSRESKTKINILKKYNDSYVALSESFSLFGVDVELVNFASIIKNEYNMKSLIYFSVDEKAEMMTIGDLSPVMSGTRKYKSYTFLLDNNQISIMKSNITKFDDAPDKIETLELTKKELDREIEIFKNKKEILDEILFQGNEKKQEVFVGAYLYICPRKMIKIN